MVLFFFVLWHVNRSFSLSRNKEINNFFPIIGNRLVEEAKKMNYKS